MIDKWDIKYIIRRVIVAIVITIVLSFLGACNAKALEFKNYSFPSNNSFVTTNAINENTWNISDTTQWGNSTGWLYFQLYSVPYVSGGTAFPVLQLQSVRITTGGNAYSCKLGNMLTYADSNNAIIGYNVECPIKGNVTSLYVKFMGVTGNNNYAVLYSSSYGTFYDSQISINTDGVSQQQFSAFQQQLRDDFASIVTNMQSSINNNSAKSAVEALQVQQQQAQQQAHQDAQQIDNTLKSEDAPSNNDISGNTDSWSSKNISNNTITQLLTMPLTLINAYLNGINGSCSSFNLGNLMGTDLILPCINVANYIGSALWSTIDVLFSGFMIFNIGRKLIKIFNDFTNLNSNQVDELYGGGA